MGNIFSIEKYNEGGKYTQLEIKTIAKDNNFKIVMCHSPYVGQYGIALYELDNSIPSYDRLNKFEDIIY